MYILAVHMDELIIVIMVEVEPCAASDDDMHSIYMCLTRWASWPRYVCWWTYTPECAWLMPPNNRSVCVSVCYCAGKHSSPRWGLTDLCMAQGTFMMELGLILMIDLAFHCLLRWLVNISSFAYATWAVHFSGFGSIHYCYENFVSISPFLWVVESIDYGDLSFRCDEKFAIDMALAYNSCGDISWFLISLAMIKTCRTK